MVLTQPTKSKFELLEPYREVIYYCNECRCGFCREECPVYREVRKESLHARGRSGIALALLDGKLSPTSTLAENLALCTTCGWCAERCPPNNTYEFTKEKGLKIDMPKIVEALRAELVLAGVGPIESHKQIASYVEKEHNPLGEPHADRFKWLPTDVKLPAKADIVYFAGCMGSYRVQDTPITTVKLLQTAGVNFTMLKDERCCGSVLLRTGQRDKVKELATGFIKNVRETGAHTVITSCAGCYKTFKSDYPEIIGKLDFEVLSVAEFLKRLLEARKIPVGEVKKKVTFQDPCHLGRHSKVYDEPRDVLSNIPGIELKEFAFNKRLAKCCGGGGGFRSARRDLSTKISKDRIREAKEIGAEAIVTMCPFCVYNLEEAAEGSMKVYDLPELVWESVVRSGATKQK